MNQYEKNRMEMDEEQLSTASCQRGSIYSQQRASDAEELAQARIGDEDRGSKLPETAMIVIVNCQ